MTAKTKKRMGFGLSSLLIIITIGTTIALVGMKKPAERKTEIDNRITISTLEVRNTQIRSEINVIGKTIGKQKIEIFSEDKNELDAVKSMYEWMNANDIIILQADDIGKVQKYLFKELAKIRIDETSIKYLGDPITDSQDGMSCPLMCLRKFDFIRSRYSGAIKAKKLKSGEQNSSFLYPIISSHF